MKFSSTTIILFLLFVFSSNAQVMNTDIKIYAVTDTIYLGKDFEKQINYSFYKVDMKRKTLQFKSFGRQKLDSPTPDLTDIFKESTSEKFEIINRNKIKIPKIKSHKVKRGWFDFATPGRTGGEPAVIFLIDGNTFQKKKGNLKYTLDIDLTKIYNQTEKQDD